MSNNNNNSNKVIVAFYKRPKLFLSIVGLVICIVHSIIYNYKWDYHDAVEQKDGSFGSTTTMISASEQQLNQSFNRYRQEKIQLTVNTDNNDNDNNNNNNNNNDDDEEEEEENFVSENNNNVSFYSYPFTFGACLQTKDDNLILPEWLAYHYTVLPLRYLIVAIDPLSLTTPEPIFEKFRSIGMTIEVWTGNWYFPYNNSGNERFRDFDPYNHTTIDAYRMRQRRQDFFGTKCLQKFHSYSMLHNNISWVMLADSDEYITYNTILPIEQPKTNKNHQTSNNNKYIQNDNDPMVVRGRLPTTIGKQNETIAHYIAYHQSKLDEQGNFSSPRILRNDSLCTVFPRLNFVAVDVTTREEERNEEENDDKTTTTSTTVQNSIINITSTTITSSSSSSSSSSFRLPTFDLPPHSRRPILPKGRGGGEREFDSSQFHTLRYFFHYKLYGRQLPGKSLVNVRNMNFSSSTTMNVQNPHRPFQDACDNDAIPTILPSLKDRKKGFVFPFRFNHYTGSLETFIARPERTVQKWLDRNNLAEKIKDFNYNDYYNNDQDDHTTTTTTNSSKKNNNTIQQQHSYDESLMEWLPEFVRLVGGRKKAFELTQQLREDALQEWAEIKRKYNPHESNARPPLLFGWD